MTKNKGTYRHTSDGKTDDERWIDFLKIFKDYSDDIVPIIRVMTHKGFIQFSQKTLNGIPIRKSEYENN